MNCDICFEPYDHSIHKPFVLSCPHTYCLSCIEKLNDNKCPSCNKVIKDKNLNVSLLRLIPESSSDDKCLIDWISLNEIKQDLKKSRPPDKLNKNQAILTLAKTVISDETSKLISILRKNEEILLNKCDTIHNHLRSYLNTDKCVESVTDPTIDENSLNKNIFEITQKLIKQSDQIKECCIEANQIAINDAIFFNNKGNNLFELKDYEEALECFNKAIKIKPNESMYYFNKGYALHKIKMYKESIEFYNKAIEINSNNSMYFNNKGHTMFALKEYESALECYDMAIKVKPNDENFYYNKALTLDELKRYQESVANYTKAIELNSNFTQAIVCRDMAKLKFILL